MAKRFIRVWNELDIKDISKHLIIIGELMGSCANCSHIGLDPYLDVCPKCKTEFEYATFTSEKDRGAQFVKMRNQIPKKVFIDYSDFKRCKAEAKARDFFK